MRRFWVRALMALVGIAVFVVYGSAAIGGYLLLSWLFAEPPDLLTALGIVAALTVVAGYLSYRFGTARLLGGLHVRELPRSRAPEVYRRLDRLCGEMDVTPPPLLVADLGAPNALSLGGPRRGTLVVDRSLLGLLTIDELEGILAHELAHMETYDTFLQTLAVSTMRSLAGLLSLFLLPLVLVLHGTDRALAWVRGRPTDRRPGLAGRLRRGVEMLVGVLLSVATLAFLAYSRRREFRADERAAEVTGKPVALARALSKIQRATDPTWGLRSLLYIHGDEQDDSLRRLFSTHPPVEDRVDRLVERAGQPVDAQYVGRLWP
ncbi:MULTISPECIES: M48 family metalloprotease [Salinibaculum]|uniref:M48 family metalloprotease n=1 Tax=Salinibaculum TaxID=2732368 RepID=UPI0030CE5F5D